ncbi:MAG: hypothetical protein II319_05440 [Clostridia bacterium]|nr:hypothetical protein [Clostridia bacterium]
MSENININVEQNTAELTKAEVWTQIIKLQDQLFSLKETTNAIIEVNDNSEVVAREKIEVIATVFNKREETLNSMLDFYKIVYNDLYQQQKNARKEKVDTIKNLWLSYLDEASEVADEDGRIEIINHVQSQLDLLAIDIMDGKI